MDLYEFCTFLVFVSLGTIGLMILLKLPGDTFDHVSDSRNGIIGIGFIITGSLLLKFDSNARARAAKKFDYDLAEYEMIRTKWLEMEVTKLELQKENSIQYMSFDQSKPIIIESPKDVSSSKEDQQDGQGMIVIEQVPEINNKPNKFIVFLLNDHYDVKIRPVVFGSIISIMAVITVLIPYIALLTVPTYLAILFAVVSDKVDYITESDEENTLESE